MWIFSLKPVRQCQTLFCDDIREEVRGKTSLIGVYQEVLHYKPKDGVCILPKLCIFNRIQTPSSDPFEHLHLKLLRDGICLEELPISLAELKPDTDGLISITANVILSPMEITQPFVFTIVAESDAEVLYGGQLKFSELPNEQ